MVMGWVRVHSVPGSPPAHSQSFTLMDFVAKGQLVPQAHMARSAWPWWSWPGMGLLCLSVSRCRVLMDSPW